MPQYPIFFTLTHDVRGQAFSARVLTRGRALITFDDGQWWCSGVNPGGMTAEGETPVQAFAHFRGDLGLIYADLAAEATSCKAFVDVVTRFVDQTNQRNLEEWKTARDRIRAGEKPEDQTIATLKRETSTPQIGAFVGDVEEFLPAEPDDLFQAA